MAVKKKGFALILCFLLFLSGCTGKKPTGRVVTKIEVACTQGDIQYVLTYREPRKMIAVLNYLRSVKYNGEPESDPEKLPGDLYEIRVINSDGTNRVYRQKANTYLYRSGSWEKIDPNWGKYFWLLLKLMPQD